MCAPEGNRVLRVLDGQLVHEGLNREDVAIRPDTSPPSDGDPGRLVSDVFHMKIRDAVGNFRGAIDGIEIDALLKSRRQPAREDGCTGDAVRPRSDTPLRDAR